MVNHKIIQFRLAYTNPVLIVNGENSILIDTGVKGQIAQFLRILRSNGLKPTDIKLIVLTHTHYDHTGNLKELKEITQAKVIVNKREQEWLETGKSPIPRGTGLLTGIIVKLGDKLMPGYASSQPFAADIFVDRELDLSPWGFDARIIHTPGHTVGSQSVMVNRSLIAGDCFFNILKKSVFPFFADNQPELLKTWEMIFDLGVDTIYPGHGKRFGVEKAKETYLSVRKKIMG